LHAVEPGSSRRARPAFASLPGGGRVRAPVTGQRDGSGGCCRRRRIASFPLRAHRPCRCGHRRRCRQRRAGTGISRLPNAQATRSASVRVAAGRGSGSRAGYGSARRFEGSKQRARRPCEANAIDRSPFCSEGRMQWTTGAFEGCALDAFARMLTDCGGAGRQWYGSAEACVARAGGFAKNVAGLRLISGPTDGKSS
jgi:hypothetical protein